MSFGLAFLGKYKRQITGNASLQADWFSIFGDGSVLHIATYYDLMIIACNMLLINVPRVRSLPGALQN